MSSNEDRREAVARSQDSAHGDGYNYTKGSPHLRHAELRQRIDNRIVSAIAAVLQKQSHCSVLEIGAGHGFFTDTVLAAGGTATVTEMSKASFEYLSNRFQDDPRVRVVYDVDGTTAFTERNHYDVILLISVLHHIPDYVKVVRDLCDSVLSQGGSIITFQDPLWYPRQDRWERAASWGAYFAWRVTQGEVKRGLATRWRRLKGVYSESDPSDLVEYHVVRQGVDEVALEELLKPLFRAVTTDRYFSTQSPQLQGLGAKYLPPNTFGIVAEDLLREK